MTEDRRGDIQRGHIRNLGIASSLSVFAAQAYVVQQSEAASWEIRERERAENYKAVFVGSTSFKEFGKKDVGTEEDTIDTIRGRESIKNIESMLQQGFRVIVVDAGVSDEFTQALGDLYRLGNLMVVKENRERGAGISPARQQGYEIASSLEGCEYIITSEVEKELDLQALLAPLRSDPSIDMTIPHRGDLSTYPKIQKRYELWGARLLNRVAKAAGLIDKNDPGFDWHNGTRAFRNTPETMRYFDTEYVASSRLQDYGVTGVVDKKPIKKGIDPKMWFDAVYAPVFLMLWHGKKVVGVNINYKHPSGMTAKEEGNEEMDFKRRFQIHSIVPFAVELVRKLALNQPRENMPGIKWERLLRRIERITQRKEEPLQKFAA